MADKNNKISDIENELSKFQAAAEEGNKIALQKYEDISITLLKAEHRIKKAQEASNQMAHAQTVALLEKQDAELRNIREGITEIRKNLDVLREQQKDFSIAILGRKMSGKSTLMEILTHGDGSAIDKGGERKADDIRSYYWHGLKIIDIPSYDFFDSPEKNQLGMETAKAADLILFLLTNEEPQPEDAQCFAQLKSLGKPVLCVINVKKDLKSKKPGATLNEMKTLLNDNAEIEDVIEKFKNFAKDYNQDWSNLKFVLTHLSAAFSFSKGKKNNAEVYAASNFPKVEEFILEKVQTDGKFLRMKNFIDSVAVSMDNIIWKLFEHSATSLQESKVWQDKQREIDTWRKKFWEDAQTKIQDIFSNAKKNLEYEVPNFAEEHYNDEKCNEKWAERIKEFGYIERYHEVLKKLAEECEIQMKKFTAELTQELNYNFDGKTQTNINFESKEIPWKDYIAKLLPNLLIFLPGIGWTARIAMVVVTTAFFSFFDDKKKKEQEAKAKFTKQLMESSLDELSRINNKARDVLNKQVLYNIIAFSDTVRDYSRMLAKLGKAQSEMAESLLKQYEELNELLFNEAVKSRNMRGIFGVKAVARIPGKISIIFTEDKEVETEKISEILGEKFLAVQPLNNWNETMKQILGCNFEMTAYVMDGGVDGRMYSITPVEDVSLTELKLAQQISPYPFIAK